MQLRDFVENAPAQIKSTFIYRSHPKNTSVIFSGEENEYLYILVNGNVDVIMQSISGAFVTLYSYGDYSCFGELELFKKDAKTYDVICQSECQTISIHKNNVFNWMQLDFEFTKLIIEQLTAKLLHTSKKVSNLSLLSVNDRLLNCIYTHSVINDLPIVTKEMICQETCAPIRSINRAIADCRTINLIDYKYKQFIILSNEKLANHCRSLV